jgi:hypothetical protein
VLSKRESELRCEICTQFESRVAYAVETEVARVRPSLAVQSPARAKRELYAQFESDVARAVEAEALRLASETRSVVESLEARAERRLRKLESRTIATLGPAYAALCEVVWRTHGRVGARGRRTECSARAPRWRTPRGGPAKDRTARPVLDTHAGLLILSAHRISSLKSQTGERSWIAWAQSRALRAVETTQAPSRSASKRESQRPSRSVAAKRI